MAANRKKIIGSTVAVLAAGYLIGLLTAPRSGKQTRHKIKNAANNSVSDIEKQLKQLYKQSQELVDKFAKENPKLASKLKTARIKAKSNQEKIRQLLSAIHDNDSVDEDLTTAINDAKQSLTHLKDYLTK